MLGGSGRLTPRVCQAHLDLLDPKGKHSSCSNRSPASYIIKANLHFFPLCLPQGQRYHRKCAPTSLIGWVLAHKYYFKRKSSWCECDTVLKFVSFYDNFRQILSRLVFMVKSNCKCWIICPEKLKTLQ
jgi:hypothetical protein